MSQTITRAAALALVLLGSLGATAASARAPVDARVVAAARAAAPESADNGVVDGRISGYDRRRGILVLGGQTYPVDPRTTAFSDDRRDPVEGGLAALRAGDKVTVRSQRVGAQLRAVQLIAHD